MYKSGTTKTGIEFTDFKKVVIKSLFSDDILSQKLVLKGGNCIDIAYQLGSRASIDLDFSMKDDFDKVDFTMLKGRVEKVLNKNFSELGFKAFDVLISKRPAVIGMDSPDWWGGYQIKFKLITLEEFDKLKGDVEACRLQSLALKTGKSKQGRTYVIDISKYEYCEGLLQKEIDGVVFCVYSPIMIVFEKLRALCQSMKEYQYNKTNKDSPRAKDFYDIVLVNTQLAQIDLDNPDNILILKEVFASKDVPLSLLKNLEEKKSIHKVDFETVKQTVNGQVEIFEYYFDYVLDEFVDRLEELGVI